MCPAAPLQPTAILPTQGRTIAFKNIGEHKYAHKLKGLKGHEKIQASKHGQKGQINTGKLV
jgi:nitrite reductase/ring-hydroxylating ferredoxin subunit